MQGPLGQSGAFDSPKRKFLGHILPTPKISNIRTFFETATEKSLDFFLFETAKEILILEIFGMGGVYLKNFRLLV